mgnify:CR=1 FL=1
MIAGSTRLAAGTAQKLVLNMLSTGAMVRLGRVHGNRMIDVAVTNAKLRRRAVGIVADLAGVSATDAERLLDESGLELIQAEDLDDAAAKAVASLVPPAGGE